MNKAFYPGLVSPEDQAKVKLQEYWPVVVTLNATMGFQVANYSELQRGVGQTGVAMVRPDGAHVCEVTWGRMTTKRDKSQGDGISINALGGGVRIKSRNANYVNRAINTNVELRNWFASLAAMKSVPDVTLRAVIQGHAGKAYRGYFSCSGAEDLILLKHIFGKENLEAQELKAISDLTARYKKEIYEPKKKHADEKALFFAVERCAYVNVVKYREHLNYQVGSFDPRPFLGNDTNLPVNWTTPVKLYKSLEDVADETLKAGILSRLVMLKLRHKSTSFLDESKIIPHFDGMWADGLAISKPGHEFRSVQVMLINLG